MSKINQSNTKNSKIRVRKKISKVDSNAWNSNTDATCIIDDKVLPKLNDVKLNRHKDKKKSKILSTKNNEAEQSIYKTMYDNTIPVGESLNISSSLKIPNINSHSNIYDSV